MGEGLGVAVSDLFDIMTSGIGTFGKGMGIGLSETAKYSFFEVSEAGAITGLGAWFYYTFSRTQRACLLDLSACRSAKEYFPTASNEFSYQTRSRIMLPL